MCRYGERDGLLHMSLASGAPHHAASPVPSQQAPAPHAAAARLRLMEAKAAPPASGSDVRLPLQIVTSGESAGTTQQRVSMAGGPTPRQLPVPGRETPPHCADSLQFVKVCERSQLFVPKSYHTRGVCDSRGWPCMSTFHLAFRKDATCNTGAMGATLTSWALTGSSGDAPITLSGCCRA